MQRNTAIEEVGNAGAFLHSNLTSAATGETMYVDCGYNITAMDIAE